jgi:hypothetical protein
MAVIRELAPTSMKQKLSGIGANEWSAQFNAMVKTASFQERYRRLGQELHIFGITIVSKWRESYHLYHCVITVEYEVIE